GSFGHGADFHPALPGAAPRRRPRHRRAAAGGGGRGGGAGARCRQPAAGRGHQRRNPPSLAPRHAADQALRLPAHRGDAESAEKTFLPQTKKLSPRPPRLPWCAFASTLRDNGAMDRFNIGAELIDRNLREGRGESPAIWFNGKTFSYRELSQMVDAVAVALLYSGIEQEQRVLMVMPDSPELMAAYLAAMKIGAVAVPCNPLLRADDYAYFLEESRARIL